MTQQETAERYNIPLSILKEYEKWGLCGALKKVIGAWQYDDEDLKRLSVIMTLHDIGFTSDEIENYMRLLLEQPRNCCARLRMIEKKRNATLEEIHFQEKQLVRLDYLRREIEKNSISK